MTVFVLSTDRAVPITDEVKDVDLRERIGAAAATLDLLTTAGVGFDIGQKDIDDANALALSFAADPIAVSKEVTNKKASNMAPATIALVKVILDEFGQEMVENVKSIRNLVINKLIIESENADPRIRLRSIELLGKMSDVALFTERSEVLITHQSSDDLKQRLKEKLNKLRKTQTLQRNAEGVFEVSDEPTAQAVPAFDAEEELAELGFNE